MPALQSICCLPNLCFSPLFLEEINSDFLCLFSQKAREIFRMGVVSYAKFGVIGLIATVAAVSQVDKTMNYIETDATVTSAKIDCYVKSGKRKLVEKKTDQMAYMDCQLAPFAAKEFGYKESDVHERAKLTFKFKSPVDGSQQKGDHTDNYSGSYKVGQKIKIYAHKSEPGTSRWN
jgi:predicted ferric reductase